MILRFVTCDGLCGGRASVVHIACSFAVPGRGVLVRPTQSRLRLEVHRIHTLRRLRSLPGPLPGDMLSFYTMVSAHKALTAREACVSVSVCLEYIDERVLEEDLAHGPEDEAHILLVDSAGEVSVHLGTE